MQIRLLTYDVFWLDRGRRRASLQLCSRGVRDNARALAEFKLSERSLVGFFLSFRFRDNFFELFDDTKSLHFLNLATVIFANFAQFTVSAHILTSKQPAPWPPPSSILNLTTVIISIITFQTVNLTGSNSFKTLLLVLFVVKTPKSTSLPFSDLSTG